MGECPTFSPLAILAKGYLHSSRHGKHIEEDGLGIVIALKRDRQLLDLFLETINLFYPSLSISVEGHLDWRSEADQLGQVGFEQVGFEEVGFGQVEGTVGLWRARMVDVLAEAPCTTLHSSVNRNDVSKRIKHLTNRQ